MDFEYLLGNAEVGGGDINVSSSRHYLLIPIDLTLEVHELEGGGVDLSVFWDSVDVRPASFRETRRMLVELMKLDFSHRERLLAFISRWGVSSSHSEGDATEPDQRGTMPVKDLQNIADLARDLLIAIAETEANDLLAADLLETFADYDSENIPSWSRDDLLTTQLPPEAFFRDYDHRKKVERQGRWERERREGRGLALQRRLIADRLTACAGTTELALDWDDSGRRWQLAATGLETIVSTHLLSIFMSSETDVFRCSVCGLPFFFDEAQDDRRPRRGVRHFCGEDCRLHAKREANRLSWQKHGSRWRPPVGGMHGKANDGTTQG